MYKIIKEYVCNYAVVASRPGNGKTATIIENIKDDLKNNKKVLLFSLESSKNEIFKRSKIKDNNLVVLDNPIRDLYNVIDEINIYDPDIVYIDYYDLLPNTKEADGLLYQATRDYNIPIIVARNLSIENDNHDLENISIDKFMEINGLLKDDIYDTYIVLSINKNTASLNYRKIK